MNNTKTQISLQALQFFAELLEDAEQTVSICGNAAPGSDRKLLIEELWLLYQDQFEA